MEIYLEAADNHLRETAFEAGYKAGHEGSYDGY